MSMNRIPNAADVPRGVIVNVTTPEERRRIGYGLVTLFVVAVGVGTTAGFLAGRHVGRKRNPRRRRRSK